MICHIEGYEFSVEEGMGDRITIRYRKRGESSWREEALWMRHDITISEARSVFESWIQSIETKGRVKA